MPILLADPISAQGYVGRLVLRLTPGSGKVRAEPRCNVLHYTSPRAHHTRRRPIATPEHLTYTPPQITTLPSM